jgi:MoxR-like ATPase
LLQLSFDQAVEVVGSLKQKINSAVFGQNDLIDEAVCCLLADGHLLMTGAPGLAKTTLVRVIAQHLGVKFGRIQFTPDLLPTDIIGGEVLNVDAASSKRYFEFVAGPIFANLLLADEINRASPRTQSALLEAMQERGVTVGGHRHTLPKPFMVFATENPFESEGTFPLPEAQLDRFLIHSLVPYPDSESELSMLKSHAMGQLAGESRVPLVGSDHAVGVETLAAIIEHVKAVRVPNEIMDVVNELVRSSRPGDPSCPEVVRGSVWYGAGPRAGLALISTAKAFALMQRREVVRWSDIRRLSKPVMRHRIRLTAQAVHDQLNEDKLVDALVEMIENKHRNALRGIES